MLLLLDHTGFTYTKTLIWPKDIAIPPTGSGCNCRGTCFDPNTCACAKLNGSDFPYAERDGGRCGSSYILCLHIFIVFLFSST